MNQEDISEIIPHLYLSNWDTSNNINIIQKYNIKAVITLETRQKPSYIMDFYKKNNIDFMYIFLYDSNDSNIEKYFNSTFSFIDKHISRDENVLVHCWAGVSRSATIVLNYMLRKFYENGNSNICECNSLNNALKFASEERPIINPNAGFKFKLFQQAKNYREKAIQQSMMY